MSKKTSIGVHYALWERINKLQRTPNESKEVVILEAIELLEAKRSVK